MSDRKSVSIFSVDQTTEIVLPGGYTYTIGDTEVGNRITMADGSQVYEETGLRRTLEITCGYLPEADYRSLLTLRRRHPFVYAVYVDVGGEEVGGIYSMTIGKRKLFSFRADGTPLFRGVTITLEAQEVS